MMNYALNCVGCPDDLVGNLSDMVEDAEEITYEEFKGQCESKDLDDLLSGLGYTLSGLRIEDDWAVHFYKSTFAGNPCVFMDHSAIEHVFMDMRAISYLLG